MSNYTTQMDAARKGIITRRWSGSALMKISMWKNFAN